MKKERKMKAADILKFAKDNNVQVIDLRFIDFPGTWQHLSVPITELEDLLEDGRGFDGSSIRGWKAIDCSDMIIRPDLSTGFLDPFYKHPTLTFICNVYDPVTQEPYSRDPRYIAQKAEAYLKSTGIGDVSYWGPEAEFFVFNSIRYQNSVNESYVHIDSVEGQWNTGKNENPNLGYKPRYKEGYFPLSPTDTLQDLRAEMVIEMQKVGIRVECQHHEVATAGQCEIDMRFSSLTTMADHLCWYKYIVKNVAKKHNMTATFMPKPLYGDNGSGMHCHQSIWKENKPLFAGDAYAGMSKMAMHYIGGLLKHAPALAAIITPTMNSYKRLIPGFEAPVNLAYSSRNRSAAIRIPMYSASPKAKRLEFRSPDPSCNPYLAFSAMLLAGIDGIQNKIDPGQPLDRDIYSMSAEELKDVPSMPGSLSDALENLEKDHAFLLKGDVFTKDSIETWIDFKREKEIKAIANRPHPMEFELYYDI
jgi:glutamine synthetase